MATVYNPYMIYDSLSVYISFDVNNTAAKNFVMGNTATEQQLSLIQALKDAGLKVRCPADDVQRTRGTTPVPVRVLLLTGSYMKDAQCLRELAAISTSGETIRSHYYPVTRESLRVPSSNVLS